MAQPPRLEAGALVNGRYEILRELGRGGRSQVFEALDQVSGKRIALKLMTPPELSRRVVTARVLAELQRAASLDHPAVTRVLSGFEWAFGVGAAMELVDGEDLAAVVAARGPLDPARSAELARDLARALAAAHARSLLHRNVKPSNVVLEPDGRVRLCDFGCTRIEGQGLLDEVDEPMRSAAFLAPEVVAGRTPDPRSDLYALGMTLYFALTGRVPDTVVGGTPAALRPDGHHPRELCPAVPEWLDSIVAHATRAQPGDRFATAQALCAALEQRGNTPGRTADPELLDVCVLCRQPGTLGRPLCPHCEDTSGEPEDVLVVLEHSPQREERREHSRRIAALSDQHASSPFLGWSAAGHLGLVRVSEDQAHRLVRRLAAAGLPVRCIPVDLAWRILPRWVEAGSALLLGAALVAAWAQDPFWLWNLLAWAGVLPFAATALVQHVALLPGRAQPRPPAGLVREVLASMPDLETSEARQLLVDCLRLGRRVDQRQPLLPAEANASLHPALAESLVAACGAARELAGLDRLLSALRLHGPDRFELPAGLLECRMQTERARAGLVQSLLETTAVLSQMLREPVIDPVRAAADLQARALDLAESRTLAAGLAKEGLAALARQP